MNRASKTTESRNRDHETIRDIMVQIKERLTVPDRATLAEQVERVQDVPPRRAVTDARRDARDD